MIFEKNVENKDFIDELYFLISGSYSGLKSDNPFEDNEIKLREINDFESKYIDPITNWDLQEDMYRGFINAIEKSRYLGFKIGFQVAIKLLMKER